MSKKANPTIVGAFVVGALTLAVIGIMAFGGASLFTRKSQCVLHFKGYIGGLNVGAPVEFNGVKIGTVTDIRIVSDVRGGATRIPVMIEIEERLIQWGSSHLQNPNERILANVHDGLRAQLAQQSLLTGLLKVNLLYAPTTPITLVGGDEFPEIPTIPSAFSQVKEQLENLPLLDIVNNVQTSIQAVVRILCEAQHLEVVQQVRDAVVEFKALATNLNTQVTSVSATIQRTVDQTGKDAQKTLATAQQTAEQGGKDLQKTLAGIQQAVDNLDKRLEPLLASAAATTRDVNALATQSAAVPAQLQETLKEAAAAARSLRTLSEYLERHPEALLRGKSDE